MGNLVSDITEDGNVWRDEGIAPPEFLLDEEPLPEPTLWVAPAMASGVCRTSRRRHRERGSQRAERENKCSESSGEDTDQGDFSVSDTGSDEETAAYLPPADYQPGQLVLQAGREVPAGIVVRPRKSTERGRGWMLLDDCRRLKNHTLLTQSRLREFFSHLPTVTRFASCWKLIYCPRIHGVSIRTFFRQCAAFPGESLVLLQDSEGVVFGGYSSETWRMCPEIPYLGAPECFVFKFGPLDDLQVFPWSGRDMNFMFACLDGFAMGNADCVAWWIDKEMLKGCSFPSSTFGTKAPLASAENFAIRNLECWAFESTPNTERIVKDSDDECGSPRDRRAREESTTSPPGSPRTLTTGSWRRDRLQHQAADTLRLDSFFC